MRIPADSTYRDEAIRLIGDAKLAIKTFNYAEGLTVIDPQRDNLFVFAALDDFDDEADGDCDEKAEFLYEIGFILSPTGTKDIFELTEMLMPDQIEHSCFGTAEHGLDMLAELLDTYRAHHP